MAVKGLKWLTFHSAHMLHCAHATKVRTNVLNIYKIAVILCFII